ncbi:hypothetical protein ZWY2020_045848 [Hordeum vulgare]|nr:hypothetical protein ZWY2020_045848 [Hordeum vulgare]
MPDTSGATVLDDLPESILVLVEEILLQLPSKDVLSCRAVRKSWRSATTAPGFLAAHHRRQPIVPLINIIPDSADELCNERYEEDVSSRYVAFRVGEHKLWPVLRTRPAVKGTTVHGAGDGLLVVANTNGAGEDTFYGCNPTTRQCAPLPQIPPRCSFTAIAGFYRHHPSQEYRVLYWLVSKGRVEYYILTVLHRGSLHWEVGWYHKDITDIMVFDTVAETFWWMHRPASSSGLRVWLLEMDGELAMCSTVDGVLLDFSVTQDYEAEVWAFKHRINLSAVAASLQFDSSRPRSGSPGEYNYRGVVVFNDRELLIQLPGRLLHCDVDGRFLGSVEYCQDAEHLGITSGFLGYVECEDAEYMATMSNFMWCLRKNVLRLTSHLFQESIYPLPCLEVREEDGGSKPRPFILAC